MGKCKSLVFREWKLSKSILKYTVLLLSAFVGMNFLAIYLNPQEDLSSFSGFLSVLLFIISASMCMIGDEEIYKSDQQSGWLTYSYCLPVTAKDRAKAATFFLLVEVAALFFLDVAGYTINSLVGRGSVNPKLLLLFFMVFDLVFGFKVLKMAAMVLCKKGKEKTAGTTVNVLSGLVAMVTGGFALTSFLDKVDDLEKNAGESIDFFRVIFEKVIGIIDQFAIVLVPVLFLLMFAYYWVCRKKYEKEKV